MLRAHGVLILNWMLKSSVQCNKYLYYLHMIQPKNGQEKQ